MRTVLITGLNGFVAVHVALAFLQRGWKVRGTVRSDQSASSARQLSALEPYFTEGSIEIVVTGPLEKADFIEAVQGVDAIAHCASPHHTRGTTWAEYRDPAVEGTLNVLRAALKSTQIRAVCLLASIASVAPLYEPYQNNKGRIYNESDWLPGTEEEFANLSIDDELTGVKWYCASKKVSELAADKFFDEHKPSWSLSKVNPPFCFGPPLEVSTREELYRSVGESTAFLRSIFLANGEPVVETNFTSWVDTADLSEVIVKTIEQEKSGRFLVSGGSFDPVILARIGRKLRPDLVEIATAPEGPTPIGKGSYTIDTSKVTSELGIEWTSLITMVGRVLDRYSALNAWNTSGSSESRT